MKRGIAIPCGLLLFAIAVAPFLTSRPTAPAITRNNNNNNVALPAAVEVAQNDDYLPPLLGIYDDQELAAPSPFNSLATVSFDEPRMLPAEILTKTDWPAAQPDSLLRVGYDNPVPPPFIPIPKNPGQTSSVMPDLFEAPSTAGQSNQAPAQSVNSRAPENLIRPKPLAMDTPSSVARFQAAEPPLAGQPNTPAPLAQPQLMLQAPPAAVPAPAPIQPVPANLAEYTGCGCEARMGADCGCGARAMSGRGCRAYQQTPLCCQSFTTCCQPCVSCCDVIESPCCGGGNGHWHPFSKLRSLFHCEQKGCGTCGPWDDCGCDECGSSHKPLFSKLRGLFHKNRGECAYVESAGCGGCGWTSGCSSCSH